MKLSHRDVYMFPKLPNRTLAQCFDVDPKTVTNCRAVVAAAYLACSVIALHATDLKPEAGVFSFCVSMLMFDETQETLALGIDDELSLAQQTSSWHVM
jgi:hypothetical protein